MGETRLQKKRRQWAEQIATWFPDSKAAKVDKQHVDAMSRRVEKLKRKQFAALARKEP
jgi:hypothetical protein